MEIIKQELLRLGDLALHPDTPRKEREAAKMVIRTFIEKHRHNPAIREVVKKNAALLEIWQAIGEERGLA
jgi:hypothetical protein